MQENELRHMGRADLIEIIYEYQTREQNLLEENAELRSQLEDRRLKLEKAGSIAEAALAVHHVFEQAQAAADQYLEEIRLANPNTNAQAAQIVERAKLEAAQIIQQAKAEAAALRK